MQRNRIAEVVAVSLVLVAAHARADERSGALGWVPAPVMARLKRVDRGGQTQGTALQGGALEGTLFRGSPGKAAATVVGADVGPRAITGRLVRVVDDPCHAGARLYEVEVDGRNPCQRDQLAASASAPFLTACERQHFDEYTGKAVAVPGAWDERGGFVRATGGGDIFSFSCQTGAAAKCARWGYRPDGDAAALALFQACTRAARADYCGTGRSFTCPGTTIDIADRTGIQKRGNDFPNEQLEADWTADGAACLHTPRLSGCSGARQIEKLKREIERECAARGRAIKLDACPTKCAAGDATCGSAVRTWMIPGQTNRCSVTTEWCPSEG